MGWVWILSRFNIGNLLEFCRAGFLSIFGGFVSIRRLVIRRP